ncbi:hypothetical protein GN156_10410 [bacterium LRH843]|nr:hypothetical protein [bacterium LRH843]
MKKWIVTCSLIFFLVLIGVSVYAYQSIQMPLYDQFDRASAYATANELTMINHIDYYYGTEAYYIVNGKNEENEEVIFWINEDFTSHHVEKSTDGITSEKALAIVQKEVNIARVLSVRLGIERDLPIYEVTYINDQNSQGYYYLTFRDGTFMKRYQLRTD